MTPSDWQAEACKRIGINEGRRNVVYNDSMGIPTVGIGFNLQRSDAKTILTTLGLSYSAVLAGKALTDQQVNALFSYSFKPIINQARSSLSGFNALSDARRFVICDLVYNMGLEGWMAFSGTRALINHALALPTGSQEAHNAYSQAASHLEGSAWYTQVGDRAKRNCAMLRNSVWCDPNGDGSN